MGGGVGLLAAPALSLEPDGDQKPSQVSQLLTDTSDRFSSSLPDILMKTEVWGLMGNKRGLQDRGQLVLPLEAAVRPTNQKFRVLILAVLGAKIALN